jgi:sRNA-binding protein
MNYRPTREESEHTIRLLVDRYPTCFFADPQHRRPLKKNILADLQKDGVPVARELLVPAVDWYRSHFGYLYALQAGAKRIDLSGKETGTVTEQEQYAAQIKIQEGKHKLGEQHRNAVETIRSLHAQGRISSDDVKKLDAPPTPQERPMKVKEGKTAPAPVLERVYEALAAADALLAKDCDALRSAMAAAALLVVVKEARRVVDSLAPRNDDGRPPQDEQMPF